MGCVSNAFILAGYITYSWTSSLAKPSSRSAGAHLRACVAFRCQLALVLSHCLKGTRSHGEGPRFVGM